jgi:hypothetical protein
MRGFFYCINNPQLNTACPYIVVSIYSIKVNTTAMNLGNQKAQIVNTTKETVEKLFME